MGMPAPAYYTRAHLRDIPDDGNRYELVRGELLVTPAPRPLHELVTSRLYRALYVYIEQGGLDLYLVSSRSELSWGDQDTEVQPDMFVVPLEEFRTMDWDRLRHPLLVVEVLSPSSVRHDRFTKRAEYQRRGVPLYWIVDAEYRQVEVWTPEDHFPRVERDALSWVPEGAPAPFSLPVQELFRPL